MDVKLLHSSVYDLPSQLRVGVIAHDGAADMQLWPGRGPDGDLKEVWGAGLQDALDVERKQVPGRELPVPGLIRVVRGRLHCDFLLWIATRPPEHEMEREPAPSLDVIRDVVVRALAFVAERNVERIAFPALGEGPGAADRVDRLAAIVEAAHAYHEKCVAEGRAPVVEEVLVCEPLGQYFRAASNRTRALARVSTPVAAPSAESAPKAPASGGRRASSTGRAKASSSRRKAALDEDEVARRRATAGRYDMKQGYASGDWLVHPKFGVGRVEEVPEAQKMIVLFEDGERRQMVHGRG
jgi:hypothetical protein